MPDFRSQGGGPLQGPPSAARRRFQSREEEVLPAGDPVSSRQERYRGRLVSRQSTNEIFKDILEAYEMIKIDKGLSTKKPLFRTEEAEKDDFQSKRPYSGQYSEDFQREKTKYGDFDSAEFFFKTHEAKYAEFNGKPILS